MAPSGAPTACFKAEEDALQVRAPHLRRLGSWDTTIASVSPGFGCHRAAFRYTHAQLGILWLCGMSKSSTKHAYCILVDYVTLHSMHDP